jgi:CheY-like chemotaxis protein
MDTGRVIVYVDDDPDDREFLKETFADIGAYELLTMENGQLLYDYLATDASSVCLIVLDINMPRISGLDILQYLKENASYKHIPVVMFTTGRSYAQARFITELGSDIITKPSTSSEIKKIANRLIEYCSTGHDPR